MYARITLVLHSLLAAHPSDDKASGQSFLTFYREVCGFFPYFFFWVTGNVYRFAKAQYCLIWR